MTPVTERPIEAKSTNLRSSLLSTPEVWGATAIAFMWLAVLFTSVYGGDLVSVNGSGSQSTTVPSGVLVAFFAFLASVSVARRAFRRETGSSVPPAGREYTIPQGGSARVRRTCPGERSLQ
jgi:hypothetical protein